MTKRAFLLGKNTLGLKYCNKDVLVLGNTLESAGYHVICSSGDKSSIINDFDRFLDSVLRNDIILFYYSGHGFCPGGKLSFVLGDELQHNENLIPVELFFTSISNKRAANKIVFLDCCNAGNGIINWNPEISDNFSLFIASDKFEKAKEIEDFKLSFFTHTINQALTTHSNYLKRDGRIIISDLYKWVIKKTKEYNFKNDTQISLPNLIGSHRTDFPIIESKQDINAIKDYNFQEEEIARIPVKRYLRERARVFIRGSQKFNKLISNLFSNHFQFSDLEDLRKEIGQLKSQYELSLSLAAFHEKLGKIEQIPQFLNQSFNNCEENACCLLYKSLALEKLDKMQEAIDLLFIVLQNSQNAKILLSAQFNLDVCYEKKCQYERVDFTRFFKKEESFIKNERLCDKALNMQLIFCHKTNTEFIFYKQLQECLKFQSLHNPIGYAKTIMNYIQVEKKKLNNKHFREIYKLKDIMNINIRIAILTKMLQFMNKHEEDEIYCKIIDDIQSLCNQSGSKTIKKHFDETIKNNS